MIGFPHRLACVSFILGLAIAGEASAQTGRETSSEEIPSPPGPGRWHALTNGKGVASVARRSTTPFVPQGVPPGSQKRDQPATLTAASAARDGAERSRDYGSAVECRDGSAGEPRGSSPRSGPQPRKPWKTLFFDNDFSGKDRPGHSYWLGEELKDISFSLLERPFRWSFGGELRHRPMHEQDRLRPGGPGRSAYQLWRSRNYLDFRAGDVFRVYVEMLDASIFGSDLPILPIDKNRWNLQNAFADVDLGQFRDGLGTLRYGRQELLFGKQRLISPLD